MFREESESSFITLISDTQSARWLLSLFLALPLMRTARCDFNDAFQGPKVSATDKLESRCRLISVTAGLRWRLCYYLDTHVSIIGERVRSKYANFLTLLYMCMYTGGGRRTVGLKSVCCVFLKRIFDISSTPPPQVFLSVLQKQEIHPFPPRALYILSSEITYILADISER